MAVCLHCREEIQKESFDRDSLFTHAFWGAMTGMILDSLVFKFNPPFLYLVGAFIGGCVFLYRKNKEKLKIILGYVIRGFKN